MSMVALQKRVGLLRSRAAGRVGGQFGHSILSPGVKNRLHHTPSGFDGVGALKQRLITVHAIIDEGFVASVWSRLEVLPIVELHCDAVHADARPWDFCA